MPPKVAKPVKIVTPELVDLGEVNKFYPLSKNLYTIKKLVEQKKIVIPCNGDVFFGFALMVDEKEKKNLIRNIGKCTFSNDLSFEAKFDNNGSVLMDILQSVGAIKYLANKVIIQLSVLFMKAKNPLIMSITDVKYKFTVDFLAPVSCELLVQNFDTNVLPEKVKHQMEHYEMKTFFELLMGGGDHLISYPFTVSRWEIKNFTHKKGKKIILPFDPPPNKKTLLIKFNVDSLKPLPITSITISNQSYDAAAIYEAQANHPFFNTNFSTLYLDQLDRIHIHKAVPRAIHLLIVSYLQDASHNSLIYAFDIVDANTFPPKIGIILKEDKVDMEITLGYTADENYVFKSQTYWKSYYQWEDNRTDSNEDGIPTGRYKHARHCTDSSEEEFLEPKTTMMPIKK
ncbi:MAG: hypothetical protein Hyperionvirus2_131 [Hyperionvirus sp.]|uniref:Uncharacterized protein n=1 Tax=Hyperionvirus sp. TaxID=2487770 RepID=A0A3G5AA79_9VIRU|nr:MAG: hypothetical protein Hyperionvirus2_131 [Hyperionvirus sp.]